MAIAWTLNRDFGRKVRKAVIATDHPEVSQLRPLQVSLKKPLPLQKQYSFMSNVKHEVQMLHVAVGDRDLANE